MPPGFALAITSTAIGAKQARTTLALNQVRLIEKPIGKVSYHKGSSSYVYDNAMTMNGLRVASGADHFVARLCDAKCRKGRGVMHASTIAVGVVTCETGGSQEEPCRWSHAREVHVDLAFPAGREFLNGPEDARIDAAGDGQLFALANVPSDRCGHGTASWHAMKMRDMAYIPLGEHNGAERTSPCRIQVAKASRCRREKNWASLVHKGRIYFVYSLIPFQILSFDSASCSGNLVQSGAILPGSETLSLQSPNLTLRGSTRYVHGLSTAEGDIYWGVVHTQAACVPHQRSTLCRYDHRVAAILVEPATSGGAPTFTYMGTLPAVTIDDAMVRRALQASGYPRVVRGFEMAYVHSITAYNPESDVADIGFHVNDDLNFRALLHGIGGQLTLLHAQWAAQRRSGVPDRLSAGEAAAKIALVTDFVLEDNHHLSSSLNELLKRFPWVERVNRARECYAKRHGYALYSTMRVKYSEEESSFPEPPVKQKTALIRKYLQLHAWVFWIDYDTIILNPAIPLDTLTIRAEGFDVIAADGGDEINAGVFAVRNSPGGFEYLRGYEDDAERADALKGHLPWRDNGYMMHAVIRGIVQDRGVAYKDECFHAGLHRSKGAFKRCFWRMRTMHEGFATAWIDGPPRAVNRLQRPNMTSGASYRVYMSNEGIMNNLLDWKGPNRYRPGDLILHGAGPNKTRLAGYLARAYHC